MWREIMENVAATAILIVLFLTVIIGGLIVSVSMAFAIVSGVIALFHYLHIF